MFYTKNYVVASSLEEAYNLKQKKSTSIIAGNAWLKQARLDRNTLIDLSNLGLDKIVETDSSFQIGAMVTLRALETNVALNDYTAGMFKKALCQIVGTQFRNTVTIGGSIWGRFGFSDPLTLLLVLNTEVRLYKAGLIPLKDFINLSYDNDILVEIIINKEKLNVSYEAFRVEATDFPVLTCALATTSRGFRLAIGARPQKASLYESSNLAELNDYKQLALKFNYASNMRASKEYRSHLAEVLIKRNVLHLEDKDEN